MNARQPDIACQHLNATINSGPYRSIQRPFCLFHILLARCGIFVRSTTVVLVHTLLYSSSASSSTLGASYCRCWALPVLIWVSVPVVVAVAGATCPVAAAMVAFVLGPLPPPAAPDLDFFFFLGFSV